jgi:hypothetical protein
VPCGYVIGVGCSLRTECPKRTVGNHIGVVNAIMRARAGVWDTFSSRFAERLGGVFDVCFVSGVTRVRRDGRPYGRAVAPAQLGRAGDVMGCLSCSTDSVVISPTASGVDLTELLARERCIG